MPPPPDWPLFYFPWFYANTGQPDRAIDAFEEALARGRVGTAALSHVLNYRDVLGDQSRYQALLDQYGITRR